MTKQATLGPIDPSLNSPLNPQNPSFPQNPQLRVPVSVESIKGYFEYAKQELKIKNENDLTKIFLELSEKVHPVVIGNVFRSRTQIQMLGKKLLSEHFKDKNKINKIISFLCSESGSHDYPIYRREARNDLGLNIETPSMDFYKIIRTIHDDICKELEISEIFNPPALLGDKNSMNYSCRRTLIESLDGGTDVFLTEGKISKIPLPPGIRPIQTASGEQPMAIEDKRTFEGWKHE